MMRTFQHPPGVVGRALRARTDIATELADPQWVDIIAGEYVRTMYPKGSWDDTSVRTIVGRWKLSLQVSETFAVTEGLSAVVATAGADLPDDYVAEHHHLYVEHGFLWLDRPIQDDVYPIPVHALTWHHGMGWSDRMGRNVPGIEINLWTEEHGRWGPSGSDFLPYGLPSLGFVIHGVGPGETVEVPNEKLSAVTRFVLALQMFMRQELPAVTRHQAPRADMKRLRRLGYAPDAVNVVDLRRRAPNPEREESTGRHLTERHIVRAHWRSYWVGPSHPHHPGGTEDTVRIWLYLMPFLRGPEDAPIRPTTERVHVVRR